MNLRKQCALDVGGGIARDVVGPTAVDVIGF